jgi:anti-sigma regulatory factor (Ser/Thr protein kinase)
LGRVALRRTHLYDAAVPEASLSLPCDPSSVPAARHFVLQTLTTWGCDDAAWAAAQIVSELAANCALHARTEFQVRLVSGPDGLRLEVQDSSPASVRPRHFSDQSTTGRGLRLVASLSRDWGVEPATSGKTVWVALDTGGDEGTGDDDTEVDVDLDALLSTFEDDNDPGREPTRTFAATWPVAA